VRAVVQRVSEASVTVGGEVVSQIGPGALILLGVASGDTPVASERLAGKVARLRIFENDDGRFDRALLDFDGEALVVSQFTLLADTTKGNRPTFTAAAAPEIAEPLYEGFCEALEREGIQVQRGRFGARMHVSLVNDGPVTIVLDQPP
jgi:D-tyrosyl-tRNA(Tyr) deacylase